MVIKMSKSKLRIGFLTACLVIFLVLAITYLHEYPPLLYYIQLTSWHELPIRLIRPAFQHVADSELPRKTEGLRALFQGGREPAIFVRFETDSDGIAYILETFCGSGVRKETFDADKLRLMNSSGLELFITLSLVQEQVGVCLFDQDLIESGCILEGPMYKIFIDDMNNTVYINARAP